MEKIICFGTGKGALDLSLKIDNIDFYIDNYACEKKEFLGKPLYKPAIELLKDRVIVISSIEYYDEIRRQLENEFGIPSKCMMTSEQYLYSIKFYDGKKEIKVSFVGFWDGFDIYHNIFIEILAKRYNVVIDERKPDYIFCSMFGSGFDYLQYNGVRIFFSGENIIPDFNFIDYGLGYNRNLKIGDRFCRFLYFLDFYNFNNRADIIHENRYRFCNFIYSHERDDELRKQIYYKLNKYKKVDSIGTYLNNMPNGYRVTLDNKLEELLKYKFSLCIESVNLEGFCTEKIEHAFRGGTIPIYVGDPFVSEIYNRNAFIDGNDFGSMDELIGEVIKIDNDDRRYYQMLKEPIYNSSFDIREHYYNVCIFLYHIFDQEKCEAYRRNMLGPSKFCSGRYAYIEKILKEIAIDGLQDVLI